MNFGVFKRRIDVDADIQITPLKSLYASGDKDAHIFELSLYRGAEEIDLSGASAQGYFIRADGYTVPITGAISGNVVTLTLSEGCYYVVGNFNLIIKVSTAESRKSVFWGNGYVVRSMTDAIVDEANVIPSLDELLAQIAAAESATKAANQAASAANSAATSAAQAAGAAGTNASAANSAANAATAAASAASAAATKINDMTISATGLAAGAAPTAELTEADGHYNIVLGLPKGDKGDTGATPQITVQVKTGEPGTAASVKQTGTAEAPVIELTIPRGDTGSLGSLTINGKAPDEAGKVMLTASDVGALSGTDATLTEAGKAADAKATGDMLNQLKSEKANKSIVSDAWQTGKTYEKGAYCIYNDRLYKALLQTKEKPTNTNDWVECTITEEIVAIRPKTTEYEPLSTDYGTIDFYRRDKVVSFYGLLTNIPTGERIELGYVQSNSPNFNYIIFPCYDRTRPYVPIGTIWIYSNGQIILYKQDAKTDAYVFGSYIVNG